MCLYKRWGEGRQHDCLRTHRPMFNIGYHHHHHHWAAVVSRGWAPHDAAFKLACLLLSSADRFPPVSVYRSSLHRLTELPCRIFLSYILWSPSGDTRGPSIVFEAVDVACSGPIGPLSFLILLIMSMTFVISLTQMLIFLFLYLCDVQRPPFHFGLCGRKFVLCLFVQLLCTIMS